MSVIQYDTMKQHCESLPSNVPNDIFSDTPSIEFVPLVPLPKLQKAASRNTGNKSTTTATTGDYIRPRGQAICLLCPRDSKKGKNISSFRGLKIHTTMQHPGQLPLGGTFRYRHLTTSLLAEPDSQLVNTTSRYDVSSAAATRAPSPSIPSTSFAADITRKVENILPVSPPPPIIISCQSLADCNLQEGNNDNQPETSTEPQSVSATEATMSLLMSKYLGRPHQAGCRDGVDDLLTNPSPTLAATSSQIAKKHSLGNTSRHRQLEARSKSNPSPRPKPLRRQKKKTTSAKPTNQKHLSRRRTTEKPTGGSTSGATRRNPTGEQKRKAFQKAQDTVVFLSSSTSSSSFSDDENKMQPGVSLPEPSFGCPESPASSSFRCTSIPSISSSCDYQEPNLQPRVSLPRLRLCCPETSDSSASCSCSSSSQQQRTRASPPASPPSSAPAASWTERSLRATPSPLVVVGQPAATIPPPNVIPHSSLPEPAPHAPPHFLPPPHYTLPVPLLTNIRIYTLLPLYPLNQTQIVPSLPQFVPVRPQILQPLQPLRRMAMILPRLPSLSADTNSHQAPNQGQAPQAHSRSAQSLQQPTRIYSASSSEPLDLTVHQLQTKPQNLAAEPTSPQAPNLVTPIQVTGSPSSLTPPRFIHQSHNDGQAPAAELTTSQPMGGQPQPHYSFGGYNDPPVHLDVDEHNHGHDFLGQDDAAHDEQSHGGEQVLPDQSAYQTCYIFNNCVVHIH